MFRVKKIIAASAMATTLLSASPALASGYNYHKKCDFICKCQRHIGGYNFWDILKKLHPKKHHGGHSGVRGGSVNQSADVDSSASNDISVDIDANSNSDVNVDQDSN